MTTYDQADYLRIPLLDGGFGVGQIFDKDKTPDDVVFCGLTARRTDATAPIAPFHLNEVVALALVTDTAIASGLWTVGGFDQIPKFRDIFDYDRYAARGFESLTVHDPAVIEAFTNAVHGLYPWTAFGPLFDQIKRPDIDRPSAATDAPT